MRMNTNPLPRALVALGLLSVACGDVVTPEYKGDPIATVGGQLTAPDPASLPETVRLAVAWYPGFLQAGVATGPKAIIAQEVSYRGTFPQRFSFDFFAPPPAGALVDAPAEEGISARAAFGLLLAYEDLNGNARLDTMQADGTGGDRVLGSSLDWRLETPAAGTTGHLLYYLESAPEHDGVLSAHGFVRGYNLVGVDGPVPLSTPIPIALTAAPTLGVHICEELYSSEELGQTPCGIVLPDPPGPDPLPTTRFGGNVSILNGEATIEAQLFTEEGSQITDAAVFAGTTPVPYDDVWQQYRLTGAAIQPGDTLVLRAALAGGGERTLTITMPGSFTLQTPTDGAQVPAGSLLSTQWTASAGADAYQVELDTGDFATSRSRLVMEELSTTLDLDGSWTGNATLTVSAEVWPGTDFPEGFLLRVGHRVGVSIVQ